MDPRSASTGPLDDPRGALVRLAERAGTEFESFARTRERTRSELDRLSRALEDPQLGSGLSIVVFGSWAREELTPESDDDSALLASEPFEPHDPAVRAGIETATTVLGTEGKELLNDLVRYWRTICVDFEGKQAQAGGDDPKWVARNAKLRTSRKLLFAGGLVPLLLCHLLRADEMPRFLTAWLRATPSDRLAAAFLQFDAVEEGARTFAAYDRWLGIMSDARARAQLAGLSPGTRDDCALWQDIRTIGREFQQGLLALLFESPLRSIASEYAVF